MSLFIVGHSAVGGDDTLGGTMDLLIVPPPPVLRGTGLGLALDAIPQRILVFDTDLES